MNDLFDNILSRSLRVEYINGDITTLHKPTNEDWRSLPYLLIAYQKNGRSCIHFQDVSAEFVETGDVLLIPAGVSHSISLESDSATYYWIHLNYYVLENLDFFNFAKVPFTIKGNSATKIEKVLKKWFHFFQNSSCNELVRLEAYKNEVAFKILGLLSDFIEPHSENKSRLRYLSQIQPALEEIHRDFISCINREELANKCNISVSQFHRIFVRAMNIGPMEYIRNLRIKRAQELLISTDLSVSEIAKRSGYSDPFIFSRYFKQKCGLSPRSYRKIKQKLL